MQRLEQEEHKVEDEEEEYDDEEEEDNEEEETMEVGDDDEDAESLGTQSSASAFSSLHLPSYVRSKLPNLGIHTPTAIQHTTIPFLLNSSPFYRARAQMSRTSPQAGARMPRDLIVQEMTGSGKSLAFLLPMLALTNNFSRNLQGVIVAPTRELAVQLYHVLTDLNSIRNPGKRRKKYPTKISLAVGTVWKDIALQIQDTKPHILVATPRALLDLINPESAKYGRLAGCKPLSLHHVRLMVFDEIDHLAQPFSSPRLEKILQLYTGVRSHSATHRLGRLVFVSAVLTNRVKAIAQKWMNRMLMATSDGIKEGIVEGRMLFRDAYKAKQPKVEMPSETERAEVDDANAAALAMDDVSDADEFDPSIDEVDERLEKDGEEEENEDADDFTESTIQPFPRSGPSPSSPVDVDRLDASTRKWLSEVEGVGTEVDDDEEERLAFLELKRESEHLKNEHHAVETQPQPKAKGSLPPGIVSADDFVLPGSERDADDAASSTLGITPVALHAAVREHGQIQTEDATSPSNADAATHATATSSSSPSNETDEHAAAPEQSFPSAQQHELRFLPTTLRHIVVHVSPEMKISRRHAPLPNQSKTSDAPTADTTSANATSSTATTIDPVSSPTTSSGPSDETSSRRSFESVIASHAKILAQLQAILQPKCALVFMNHSADLEPLAQCLRESKRIRVAILSKTQSTRDRIKALDQIRRGQVTMVLATDMASRGLDLPRLTHVINFDVPRNEMDYVHRSGRVERLGGQKGCSVVTVVTDPRLVERNQPKPYASIHNTSADNESSASPDATSASSSALSTSPPPPSPQASVLVSGFPGHHSQQLHRILSCLHLAAVAEHVTIQRGKFSKIEEDPIAKQAWLTKRQARRKRLRERQASQHQQQPDAPNTRSASSTIKEVEADASMSQQESQARQSTVA